MFLLKLFGRAALTLALLGVTAGIIAAGGCGKYVPHEPEQPGITDPNTPGKDPEEPEGPEGPEDNYVYGYLRLEQGFGYGTIYEYTGEFNALHISEHISSGSGCVLAIGNENKEAFSGTNTFVLTFEGSGPVVYEWYAASNDGYDVEQIVFTNGSAQVTIEDGGLLCGITAIDSVVFDIDLTITLERI